VVLRLPATSQEYGLGASWSPDGTQLVYTDDTTLRVVAVDGGREIARLTHDGTTLAHDYRAPLWLGPDTIVVAARDTLWRFPLGGGTPLAVAMPVGHQLLDVVAHGDAQRLEVRDGSVLVTTRDRETKRLELRRVDLRT